MMAYTIWFKPNSPEAKPSTWRGHCAKNSHALMRIYVLEYVSRIQL